MDRTNREQFDCVSFVQFIFVGHQKASKTNRKKILLLGGWNPFVSRHTARYCATCTTAPHPASESQILGNVWGYVSYPLAIYLYRLPVNEDVYCSSVCSIVDVSVSLSHGDSVNQSSSISIAYAVRVHSMPKQRISAPAHQCTCAPAVFEKHLMGSGMHKYLHDIHGRAVV